MKTKKLNSIKFIHLNTLKMSGQSLSCKYMINFIGRTAKYIAPLKMNKQANSSTIKEDQSLRRVRTASKN